MRRTTRVVCLHGGLGALALFALVGAGPTTDSWDAVYLGGSKVGHVHTFIESVKDKGRDLLRVRFDMVLSFKRGNDTSTVKMQYGTIETRDGSVLRLDTRTVTGNQELRVHGDADAAVKTMTLVISGTGETQKKTIDWGDDVRGPYAAEQTLSREPIKPGESRVLKMYMPDLNQVCEITLTAKGREEVKLGGGSARTLLRVDQTTTLDGKPRPEFDVSLWVDASGQVLKSKTDNFGGMYTYRTTETGALAAVGPGPSFNLIQNTVIKVRRKILNPEAKRDVRYKVTLRDDDPTEVIPGGRRQTLRRGASRNEAILEVTSDGPETGQPEPEAVDPVYLRPNALITSRDEKVVGLARKAVGASTDPWEKARKVQRWVATNLKDKNFETSFASASEVARNLAGDCTEHAVLVAAMCRAEDVPARVAVGLVYAEPLGGFGFHMWNEVFVNRRWVAIDAAFAEDTVDAVHIKLADASLDGVSPFETFLPVIRVAGKMTLEPIEIR